MSTAAKPIRFILHQPNAGCFPTDRQIRHIENIQHLSELRVLNLAGNAIEQVKNLRGLDSLTELNLRRNKIQTVVDKTFGFHRWSVILVCVHDHRSKIFTRVEVDQTVAVRIDVIFRTLCWERICLCTDHLRWLITFRMKLIVFPIYRDCFSASMRSQGKFFSPSLPTVHFSLADELCIDMIEIMVIIFCEHFILSYSFWWLSSQFRRHLMHQRCGQPVGAVARWEPDVAGAGLQAGRAAAHAGAATARYEAHYGSRTFLNLSYIRTFCSRSHLCFLSRLFCINTQNQSNHPLVWALQDDQSSRIFWVGWSLLMYF